MGRAVNEPGLQTDSVLLAAVPCREACHLFAATEWHEAMRQRLNGLNQENGHGYRGPDPRTSTHRAGSGRVGSPPWGYFNTPTVDHSGKSRGPETPPLTCHQWSPREYIEVPPGAWPRSPPTQASDQRLLGGTAASAALRRALAGPAVGPRWRAAKPQDSRVVDGAEQGLRGQTGGD